RCRGVAGGDAAGEIIEEAPARGLEALLPHFDGPHAALADRLQQELADARDPLLDPDRRQVYDILTPQTGRPPAPVESEALPPPPEPPPAKKPWWQEVTPEDVPPAPAPWWKEGPPPEKPVVPPARVVPATAAWSEALPGK